MIDYGQHVLVKQTLGCITRAGWDPGHAAEGTSPFPKAAWYSHLQPLLLWSPVPLGSTAWVLLEIIAGVLEEMGFALKVKLLLFMVCVTLTIKHNPSEAIFMCKMEVLMAIVSALRED